MKTLRACEAKDASGMVFNGGTGARVTLNQVLKLLEKITEQKINPKYDPQRNGDIRDSQADISLSRRVLGYEPKVQFEEGLRHTWEWYKDNYGK
jgi:UDP-glucose 4-epimerase